VTNALQLWRWQMVWARSLSTLSLCSLQYEIERHTNVTIFGKGEYPQSLAVTPLLSSTQSRDSLTLHSPPPSSKLALICHLHLSLTVVSMVRTVNTLCSSSCMQASLPVIPARAWEWKIPPTQPTRWNTCCSALTR